MLVTVELSEEDIKEIKERQVFRMQWIQSGADEKEPFDFVVQKILNAISGQQEKIKNEPK